MLTKTGITQFSVVVFLFLGVFLSITPLLHKQVFAYYTNMSASVVLGQVDFTSTTGGNSQTKIAGLSRGIFVDTNGRLIVSDYANHRVLVWNAIPTENGKAADLVLGQSDFTNNTANRGGTMNANTFNFPLGVYSDGTKLFVVDEFNDRVLLWNTFPTSNGQSADVVIGQQQFTSKTNTCDNLHPSAPTSVGVHNGKVIVTDRNHRRALIWNAIPTTNGETASVVLGQNDMTTCTAPTQSASSLNSPRSLSIDQNGKLFIVDATSSHRVLIWNSFPTSNNETADVVVGQSDFTSTSARTTADGLSTPVGVYSSGSRLFIADQGNVRTLVYNSIPSSSGASADVVIGQSNFTSGGGGTTSASSNISGQAVVEFNNKLIVADASNARVLVFNNVLSTPQLFLGSPELISNGRMKVSGSVTLGNRGTYSLQNVQVSVNGSGFAQATNISGGTDGGNNNTNYVFSHEFEPWTQSNGTREEWISDNSGMSVSKGYTLLVKAISLNAEEDNLFLFTPFKLNSVSSGVLPTVSFSVNSSQWDRIKDSLSTYEVHIKKNLTTAEKKKGVKEYDWTTYLEGVPVDSTSTQNPSISTTFDKTTGTITIRSKSKILPSGTYTVQVLAKDKWGHTTNQTNELRYTSTGVSLVSTKPSLPVTTEWFPLQVNKISGISTGVISNFNPSIKSSYLSTTSTPTFEGIAFNNTTVSIQVTDTKSGKTKLYTTTPVNSVFKVTPTLFSSSLVDIWVTDGNGRYNELPSLVIQTY